MQMYPLAIASAEIRHRRFLPKAHAFETRLNYLYFDPDQLSSFTEKSWLWSCNRWNFLTLDERDFLTMECWPCHVHSDFALILWCFIWSLMPPTS